MMCMMHASINEPCDVGSRSFRAGALQLPFAAMMAVVDVCPMVHVSAYALGGDVISMKPMDIVQNGKWCTAQTLDLTSRQADLAWLGKALCAGGLRRYSHMRSIFLKLPFRSDMEQARKNAMGTKRRVGV